MLDSGLVDLLRLVLRDRWEVAVLIARNVMEQRYEAVMAVLRDGEPVTEVAVRFGVSRQCVHAWMRRNQDGGITASADGSSSDELSASDAS